MSEERSVQGTNSYIEIITALDDVRGDEKPEVRFTTLYSFKFLLVKIMLYIKRKLRKCEELVSALTDDLLYDSLCLKKIRSRNFFYVASSNPSLRTICISYPGRVSGHYFSPGLLLCIYEGFPTSDFRMRAIYRSRQPQP